MYPGIAHPPMEGADTDAVDRGYVSITPLDLRITRTDHLGVAAALAGTEEA